MTDLTFFVKDSLRDETSWTKNCCYLIPYNWDDYGFKTTFSVYYINNESKQIQFGLVQILQKGQLGGRTELPKIFQNLGKEFCSLGGQGYYEAINTLDKEIRNAILNSLSDCILNREIRSIFLQESGMQNSLLRGKSLNAMERFKRILDRDPELTPFSFNCIFNNTNQNSISIVTDPNSFIPTNIHAIIGRNGTGKTRILSGISRSLMNIECLPEKSENCKVEYSENSDTTNTISNLIVVAFSAFDNFEPLIDTGQMNIRYSYIGLKKAQKEADKISFSLKSLKTMKDEFSQSINFCIKTQRTERLISILKIMESDPIFRSFSTSNLVEKNNIDSIIDIYTKASSGHRLILHTLVKLVELVDERTLILIDEPETYLHPPLLSSYIRAISFLLRKRNAVAIIATHSPVVLQEVPKSCVTIVSRINNIIEFSKPDRETFGENIDTLTKRIFGLELIESGFYHFIKEKYDENDESKNKLIYWQSEQLGTEARMLIFTMQQNERKDEEN